MIYTIRVRALPCEGGKFEPEFTIEADSGASVTTCPVTIPGAGFDTQEDALQAGMDTAAKYMSDKFGVGIVYKIEKEQGEDTGFMLDEDKLDEGKLSGDDTKATPKPKPFTIGESAIGGPDFIAGDDEEGRKDPPTKK
jgi:hypothetical protein